MYCTNCGHERPDNALACPSCGTPVQRFPAPPNIPNYLIQSILVTLCCCMPFGIVAIVYSAQVNGKIAAGDIPGAMASSRNAKMWAWVSFGVGVLLGVISIGISVVDGLGKG